MTDLKKRDIPKLSSEDRRNTLIGMILANTYTPVWFIEERLGAEAARDYQERGARDFARTFKANGHDTPLELASYFATPEKHMLGSDVELLADGGDEAVLVFHHCNRLERALAWADMGQGKAASITRESYCATCLDRNLAIIAHELDLILEGEFFDGGCRLRLRTPPEDGIDGD